MRIAILNHIIEGITGDLVKETKLQGKDGKKHRNSQCRGRGRKETQKEGDVRKTSHVGSDTSDTLQSNSFADPNEKDWGLGKELAYYFQTLRWLRLLKP